MMHRRSMLTALLAAVASGGLPLATSAREAAPNALTWRNWSGVQTCQPRARVAAASVGDLQDLVARTQGTLRPVGAGHSFSALVPTDGTLVSLARLNGVIEHDPATLRATLWGGTRLADIGEPLEQLGQAMVNMPDIDHQSLAGCLATATHGTGAKLECLSGSITGLEFVDARGALIYCDAHQRPDIFQAARVSLGALGIVTRVKLQNRTPYRLRRETVWRPIDDILAHADELADRHRNFEFFYIPFTGMGFTDSHDITDAPSSSNATLDDNDGLRDLQRARDWLQSTPRLRELVLGTYLRTLRNEVTVARSWNNYASERSVRFNEMEYHLPRERGPAALREIREVLETHHPEVFFPIECRYVKGDDIWLSPFHQRDTCSIAVHRHYAEDHRPLFRRLEPILRRHGGRPHWGKLHTLQREDLRAMYPHWDDFVAVRRELDPAGKFLNPYLKSLFT